MFRFIASRLLQAIPVLFVLITVSFFLVRLAPGGPFSNDRNVTAEVLRNLEAHYGLDKSLPVQYWIYLCNLLRGDLGHSYTFPDRTVNQIIADSFPVSAELGCYAMAVAMVLGLGAGIIASIKPNSISDYLPMSLAMVGICLPTFVMGPVLALLFGITLGWFNASGWFDASDRVLPALTLGGYYAAYVARMTRGGMLEVLSQDYIRTARAKGASPRRVILRHALKGGLLPVVSFLGPAVAGMITGSFVVEKIFQIPGLGQFFISAALNRDYTLVLGTVLFYATLIIVLNLVVDIVQVWLNPKLRFE